MPENPKVMFKRGLQSALLNADGSAKITVADGSFYLTTDTNRLYVGNGSDIVELNKSITVVDSVNDLPKSGVEVGQFYYIKGSSTGNPGTDDNGNKRTRVGNILAVVTEVQGGVPTWVQVNPDTNDNDNDNTWVSGFSIEKDTENSVAGSNLVYKWTLQEKDNKGQVVAANDAKYPHPVSGSFTIAANDIAALAGANVGLAGVINNDNLELSTNGSGSNGSAKVTLTPGDNIGISGSGSNFTISATDTTYIHVVNSTNKSIVLTGTGTTPKQGGTTTFAAGNAVEVTVAASNENKDATVTVAHSNVTRSDDIAADNELGFSDDFSVVTGITTNAQGHVTKVTTQKVILPDETKYSITNIGVDSEDPSKLSVTLSDGVTPITKTSVNKDLYFTVGDNASAATNPKVYNQGNLSVYTRSEIDERIRTLDAMVYKGTVPSSGLPTTQVENGDTYKVDRSGITIPGTNGDEAKPGDIFIAHGTEGTDGYLSTATWDYIPAGDEIDTRYTFSAANNVITLDSSVVGDADQTVTIAGGNKLTASTANNTITINHDAITTTGKLADDATAPATTQTLEFGGTFTVVHGAKADGYGHISEIQTATYQLPDTPETVTYSLVDTVSSGTGHGNGKVELKDSDGHGFGEIAFQNGNKTIAVVEKTTGDNGDNAVIKINHETLTPTITNNTTGNNIQTIDVDTGFTTISAIGVDSYGHVNAYTTQKFQLPDAVVLTLNGNVTGSSNKANVALHLNDKGTGDRIGTGVNVPAFSLSSSSLTVTTTAATASTPANIAVDIEWGTF